MKSKLSDIAEFKNGINFNKSDKGNFIKCIGVGDFGDICIVDNFDNTNLICVDKKISEEYFLKDNDIIFVRSNGNKELVGRSMIVFPGNENVVCSGFCIRMRLTTSTVLPLYIYFLMNSPTYKRQFAKTQQTNINNLNQTILGDLVIDIPSIDVQKRIVNTLIAVHGKISNNNKINDNLQQQLKLLYDYWFTQFDFPDDNGKPYRASGGKMVWNEELQRKIPQGWKCKSLAELLCKNIKAFDYNTVQPTIDLSVMPSSSISLNQINTSDAFATNLFEMKEGDILFGSIRPYLKKAGIAPCDGVVAGTIHSYRPIKESDYNFALLTISRDTFFDYAVRMSSGTKMPVISSDNLLAYKVPYSEEIVKRFNEINLKQNICLNIQEIQRLNSLRDWLLPMLMTGQAIVSD